MYTIYILTLSVRRHLLDNAAEYASPFIQQLVDFTVQIPFVLQIFAVALWSMIPFVESDAGAFIGVIVGIPVIPAVIAAIVGNWLAVMGIVILTHKIRAWLYKQKDTDAKATIMSKKEEKVRHAVKKYGIPGASLLGPILIGTHLNAFFMAAAGADKRYLMIWQTIAITIWGIISGTIAYLVLEVMKT